MPGKGFNWFRSFFVDFFATYSTVKQIEVRKTYVGSVNRILQFVVITYIAFYIVWIKKGYQGMEVPRGSSIIKVKGAARVSISNTNNSSELWDAAEYLIPPFENNAFFITTRKTVTYAQIPGKCPIALDDKWVCNSTDSPCKQGKPTPDAFGFLTGNCVPSQKNIQNTVCEISAWCPLEVSNSVHYKIDTNDLQYLTVFIKTIVAFTQFNIKIRTVQDNTNFSCRFNSDTDRRCPIFSIEYILQQLRSQEKKIDLLSLYHQGGLIEIEQNWQCNFDLARERKECFPVINFNLLQSGSDRLSPGINYRFAEKYYINGVEYRKLIKVYGLRFVLSIRGRGRRFDIVHLFLAIGSGIGYMIIAEVICEFILTKFHKYRKEYTQNKIEIYQLKQSSTKNSLELSIMNNHDLEQPLLERQT